MKAHNSPTDHRTNTYYLILLKSMTWVQRAHGQVTFMSVTEHARGNVKDIDLKYVEQWSKGDFGGDFTADKKEKERSYEKYVP